MFDLGEDPKLSINITDANGDPADAGAVNITVTLPDGTAVTNGVTPIAPTVVGQYDFPYTTVQAGRHQVRWVATGANADTHTSVFEVRPLLDTTFLSLAEMKEYLNIRDDKTAWDGELRDALVGGCAVVEFLCGPIARRTVTEYHDGGAPTVVLYNRPVISVTSVDEVYGATSVSLTQVAMPDLTNAAAAFTADLTTGELRRRANNWEYVFPYGKKNVKVVYVVGRTVTPGNISLATKELVGHLWRASQLNSEGRRPRITRPEPVTVVLGFAVPNRVLELLQATPRIPAIG